MSEVRNVTVDLIVDNGRYDFTSSISSAKLYAESELQAIEETETTLKSLKPECDKLDYILAASSGIICGIVDIFLVGKPGESSLGNSYDEWIEERTKAFAKLLGWKGKSDKHSSYILFLEKKFKVPYDQRGMGDAGRFVYNLEANNHHFKSLSHNPTLLGLFFSILDQFNHESHFVTEGEMVCLVNVGEGFELKGKDVPSKLFCGIANWFGHIISDQAGSNSSKGRGMGIPSQFWAWTNNIIAIKRSLKIESSDFDKAINELALNLYVKGYDSRFQKAQAIPVLINEMLTRLIYSTRRLISFFFSSVHGKWSFPEIWAFIKPFNNPSVRRMLTVAHGSFCLMDVGEATIQAMLKGAGSFNVEEFCMRINIIGVGRFAISIVGEVSQGIEYRKVENETEYNSRKKVIIEDYIDGLSILSEIYEDPVLLSFADDFKNSSAYQKTFEETVLLAEKRCVPKEKILRNMDDIDNYFLKG